MREPVLFQWRMRPTWNRQEWPEWQTCSKEAFHGYEKITVLHDWEYQTRKLYDEPAGLQAGSDATLTSEEIAEAEKVLSECEAGFWSRGPHSKAELISLIYSAIQNTKTGEKAE